MFFRKDATMATAMFPVPQHAQSAGASDVKWFAGLAMQAIINSQSMMPDSPTQREEIALWAFRMGETMAAVGKQLGLDTD
jgi:hypothetical protein